MTFDEWFQSKQGEPYDSMYPFARGAFEAGRLEAAQHIVDMWRQPWGVAGRPFIKLLEAYVEELK